MKACCPSLALGCLLFLIFTAAGPGTLPTLEARRGSGSATAAELRPGVIVDPSGGVVYLMNPDGGIDAVSVHSGRLLWSTAEAAKPLAIHGETLIAQGGRDGALDVVVLNQEGKHRLTLPLKLPEGVWGLVDEGLDKKLEVRADILEGTPFVSWEYTRKLIQGIAPRPDERSLESKSSGTYRLDLAAGRAVAVEASAMTKTAARPLPDAVQRWVDAGTLSHPPAQLGAVLAATQVVRERGPTRIVLKRWQAPGGEALGDVELFTGDYILEVLSADGGHLLVAERVAPGEWDEYGWSVFSLETGERLGGLRNHQSHAWFAVEGSTLIYVARGYGRRVGDGWIEEPRMLRAIRLDTGVVAWERPLRDPSFRGSFPP